MQKDKDNVTLKIKIEDNLQHCLTILSGKKYYKIIVKDPTVVIQNQFNNKIVTNLKKITRIT